MYTLAEVIKGLRNGCSYERPLSLTQGHETDTGTEYLTPITGGRFRHDVAGNSPEHGGWGGSNEMPLGFLHNGRFAQEGWKSSTGTTIAQP